jgi:hypothetical protein
MKRGITPGTSDSWYFPHVGHQQRKRVKTCFTTWAGTVW